jgi:beta-glucanase (GH16 family)
VWRGDEDPGQDGLGALTLQVAPAGADALNPHGDGSGVVALSASAAGAVRFVFTIDGRDPVESSTGQVEVVVDQEGSASYLFEVAAFGPMGETERTSVVATVYRSDDPFPRLVWADEFDVDGPVDPEKWKAQVIPPIDGGWFNGEQQHYTDRLDNAYVTDGTLKIVAKKERYVVDGSARDYTSARLNSRFAFTYGRVEARARLPVQAGTWPAIWTLGANVNEVGNPFGDTYGDVGWPACGEIDILEQRGGDKQSTIGHFHWGDTRTGAYGNEGGVLNVPTSTSAFHVYSVHWDEEILEIRVDDRVVHRMPNDAGRPFDNPHYLLLNVAMGGGLGGAIPANFAEATLEVDWVRVYR